MTDTFLDRPRTHVTTSMGELDSPTLYRDATVVAAFFPIDFGRAADLLAGTPLVPARFVTGAAIAGLMAFDYRDTTIGPYREVGIAIAAIPRGIAAPALPVLHLLRERAHEDVGWYVLDLPVTTAIADVAGRELFGFPKFVTSIDVAASDGLRVVVSAPTGEEPILVFEGHGGPGVMVPAMDLVVYTVLDGTLLRTLVEMRGWMHTGLGRGLALHVGDVEHPMGARLAALGLDGDRPFATQICRRARLVLNAGVPFRAGVAHAA